MFWTQRQLRLVLGEGKYSEFGSVRVDVSLTWLYLRICPGRYLAQNSLWLFVASTLHAFHIEPILDEAGYPVDIVPGMSDEIVS